MGNNVSIEMEKLDQEWIDLILAALEAGMSVQEIRNFLNKSPELA